MAAEDVGGYRAALEHLRATHEPMSVEYRVTAGDGREVWVRDVAVVAREDDGELYIHGYLSDVTREKALERELAAERAQAVAFFRDSPVGLGITDAEGRYTRVNDALARLNGVTVADFVGRTLAEVSGRGGDGRPDPRRGSAHGCSGPRPGARGGCATASAW